MEGTRARTGVDSEGLKKGTRISLPQQLVDASRRVLFFEDISSVPSLDSHAHTISVTFFVVFSPTVAVIAT